MLKSLLDHLIISSAVLSLLALQVVWGIWGARQSNCGNALWPDMLTFADVFSGFSYISFRSAMKKAWIII